jgi:hypothetical protein
MVRVRELMAQRFGETFVGRSSEVGTLLACLDASGPLVLHVHGIGGIGKSALMTVFCERARARGAIVVRVDCRSVEPTEAGLLEELRAAVGARAATVAKVTERLGRVGDRVVIVFDTYEVFRLMDTWLRQVFVPSLPENIRVVIAGREEPVASWRSTPGADRIYRSLPLGPLDDDASADLLHSLGVDSGDAQRLNRFARGHPLSLHLAASALRDRPGYQMEEGAIPAVVEELTKSYLGGVRDPVTLEAIEAASVVRCTTQSALHAMLPPVAPHDAFERIRALPFVERRRDGLIVHDTVKRAISTLLRTSDPARHRAYRRAAWQQFRTELRTAAGADLWRTTADLLYLIENPVLREAFFPESSQPLAVEPQRSSDATAILDIARRHEGPDGVRSLRAWLERVPRSVSVVRGNDEAVRGFYFKAESEHVSASVADNDPVARAWLDYLRRHPVERGERVLFVRRWLSVDHGERPSAEQAACWLDCKRAYLELRPQLRRVVVTLVDLPLWAPVATELGFTPLDFTVDLDGTPYHSAVLDFGPASVDGWLTRLLAAELGVIESAVLDDASHEVVIAARRITLSDREFDVLRYLWDHEGRVVDRGELLEEVWEGNDGGSNIVDVVIRSLRRKLGGRASMIETLRGQGYRFRNG